MSELISGKEALIALANGEDVLFRNKSTGDTNHAKYQTAECIQNGYYEYCGERIHLEFFIKPRTITINEIEVPAPFEPKLKDVFYYLDGSHAEGFSWRKMHDDTPPWLFENLTWRTEKEIKQVVAALRSIFNTQGK